jgi:flagellar basal body rod protein FlgC
MSLIGTMGSGVSALRTFSKGLEVIGDNIANVNTTGYKCFGGEVRRQLQQHPPAFRRASANGAGNSSSIGYRHRRSARRHRHEFQPGLAGEHGQGHGSRDLRERLFPRQEPGRRNRVCDACGATSAGMTRATL